MSTLNTALSTALSGMTAAQAMLNVTANNVANLDTPGYQSEEVDLAALPDGGVGVEGLYTDDDAMDPSADAAMANGGSNVDLATQATNLSDARLMYNANAAVISITNDMYGSLLDIFDNQDSDQDGNS